jgi:hypothetical protein
MIVLRTVLKPESLHPLKRQDVEWQLRRFGNGAEVVCHHFPGIGTLFHIHTRDGRNIPCDFPEPEGGGIGEFFVYDTKPMPEALARKTVAAAEALNGMPS